MIDVDQIVPRGTPPTNSWRPPAIVAGVFHPLLIRRCGGARDGIQRGTVCVERHQTSAVVTPPQPAADLSECRQLVPTSASTARSRHTVALARCLRIAVDRLPHQHHHTGITNCRSRPNGRQGTITDPQWRSTTGRVSRLRHGHLVKAGAFTRCPMAISLFYSFSN